MMKRYLTNMMKFFLPLIFIVYLGGITLFTHSHVVNGVIIVHSHPFKGEHQHTEVEFETIFFLSAFVASDGLFTPFSVLVFLVLLCVLGFRLWSDSNKKRLIAGSICGHLLLFL